MSEGIVRLLTGYPIHTVATNVPEISFWRDEALKLYVHFKSTGFLFNEPTTEWYNSIKSANLPLNHKFFALLDRVGDKVIVYMLEDMNENYIYNWEDMAWFCTENDVDLEILDRSECPRETQKGGKHIRGSGRTVSSINSIKKE